MYSLHFFPIPLVTGNGWVQVAVAGMAISGDGQVVFLGNLLQSQEHSWYLATGNSGVFQYGSGPQACTGRQGSPAGGPQVFPFGIVPGDLDLAAVFPADPFNDSRLFGDNLRNTVHFQQEYGRRLYRKAGVAVCLHCTNGNIIHNFHSSRYNLVGDDLGDGPGGPLHPVKDGQHAPPSFRRRDQAHGNGRHDPQGSLTTAEKFHQIVAANILYCLPTAMKDGAVGQNDLQPHDIILGNPVLEAPQAPRGLCHATAHGSSGHTSGIGRVDKTMGGDGVIKVLDNHPRLNGGCQVFNIQLQDLVHLGKRDDQAIFPGNDPAAQIGTCTPGVNRHPVLRSQAHNGYHFFRRPRQGHGQGQVFGLGGRSIKGVAPAVLRFRDEPFPTQDTFQFLQQFLLRRQGLSLPPMDFASGQLPCACCHNILRLLMVCQFCLA
ncbi:predicted protease with the C-terminal PDZ domain [Moorella thermoacetica Y72]|uniref:Predicted protease with the C-terminal PDZ domain n=1 Tax=Moorella thermoacetica Y72 TaxID=1325331 RepID=A0A0S6UC82_NEOTH|nr:predicted protease with the C-terminal PDZ domain [Moorella thermoacetica Y72]